MDTQNQINPQNPAPSSTTVPAPALTPVAQPQLNKSDRFKRLFYQILIGCLIAAAAIAVIAVLAGGFNNLLGRALGTIAMVALHAVLSFGYINQSDKKDKKDGGRSIDLFSEVVFTLIVASFITSIFATWQVLAGHLTLQLYLSYGALLFATLHADVLYRIRRFEKIIDNIVTANYVSITLVVIMLFLVIFSSDTAALPPFFFRLLAAIAIVDATMTLTSIIMHKLFLQKHPESSAAAAQSTSAPKNFWHNPFVILLLIFLAAQVIYSVVALLAHN